MKSWAFLCTKLEILWCSDGRKTIWLRVGKHLLLVSDEYSSSRDTDKTWMQSSKVYVTSGYKLRTGNASKSLAHIILETPANCLFGWSLALRATTRSCTMNVSGGLLSMYCTISSLTMLSSLFSTFSISILLWLKTTITDSVNVKVGISSIFFPLHLLKYPILASLSKTKISINCNSLGLNYYDIGLVYSISSTIKLSCGAVWDLAWLSSTFLSWISVVLLLLLRRIVLILAMISPMLFGFWTSSSLVGYSDCSGDLKVCAYFSILCDFKTSVRDRDFGLRARILRKSPDRRGCMESRWLTGKWDAQASNTFQKDWDSEGFC